MRCAIIPILLVIPTAAAGQDWNTDSTLSLVRRAVQARATEPGIQPFQARGRGLVTFHVEVGALPSGTVRLMKVDEIAVVVRRNTAGVSRQVITGWRDTTLFPSGMIYHRDHLGIVTDDFGPAIRLGQGDEVREVPHPLSIAGEAMYEYRVRDTVRLAVTAGELTLVTVDVRPTRPHAAAVVGSVDVEVRTAALVRSRFTFTGAAYRDPDLEDISVRLERSFIDGRAWLPYRQEVEIRRKSAVLDVPFRGVIRGRWEISEYDLDPTFADVDLVGPPIGGLRRPGGPVGWSHSLLQALDSLPGAAGSADLARVRREATRLAQGRFLAGLPPLRPGVDRLSDVMRVNRVQGLVLGGGMRWRSSPAFAAAVRADVGSADGRVTGSVELNGTGRPGRWSVTAERRVADVGDVPVASGLIGSLAAQEGGRDYGDYVLLERIGLEWRAPTDPGLEVAIGLGREWAWSVATEARPVRGSYRPNPPLGTSPFWIARVAARAGNGSPQSGRVEGHAAVELGTGAATTYGRLLMGASAAGRIGGGLASLRATVGAGTTDLPARRSFAIGGRATLPGEPFRAWGGRHVGLLRIEWHHPVPWVGIPLGRYGRTSNEARIGPFVAAGWAGSAAPGAPWSPSPGVRVVTGLVIELLDRAVRVEIGRSLSGGSTGVTFDVSRDWWPVL